MVRPAYISHVVEDFGSYSLHLEVNFGLPSFGYAGAYADEPWDGFNFTQTPAGVSHPQCVPER